MIKFLKKVPYLFFAILFVSIAILLTHYLEEYLIYIKWIKKDEGEARVALYSSVLTVIGILYGVMQLQSQRKDSLFANEYMNQPEFEFLHFCTQNLLENNGFPGCCCVIGQICTNNCIDEHWFNIKQIGNLPATDIKISMFHKSEMNNVCCDNRVQKIETLNKGGIYQYKLPPYTFPEKLFDPNANSSFFILLSYKSLYSNLRYKRIYELEYKPNPNPNLTNGLWGDNINFYSTNLKKITDYNSISLKDIMIGSLGYHFFKLKLKTDYSKESWILKY
jgi:hypothetical protein